VNLLDYHIRRAQDLYDRYRVALAKVDEYERTAIAKAGEDPVMAVGLYLSDRTNPRPAYKALTGAKDGLQAMLGIELGMVSLYDQLQRMGRADTRDALVVYRRMAEFVPK